VEDEARWEARLLANAADHQRWLEHGFMRAWRQFMAREQLALRLLPLPDGERRLTNLSHLAELLQSETDRRHGMAPLLAWLEGRVANPPGGEEAMLRLESDAALVKIVTIHTSGPAIPGGVLPLSVGWRAGAAQYQFLALPCR
jgi:exodeoxyribonuclease V beta subunit